MSDILLEVAKPLLAAFVAWLSTWAFMSKRQKRQKSVERSTEEYFDFKKLVKDYMDTIQQFQILIHKKDQKIRDLEQSQKTEKHE